MLHTTSVIQATKQSEPSRAQNLISDVGENVRRKLQLSL